MLTSFFLFLRFEGWGFDSAVDDLSFKGDADAVEAAAAIIVADAGLGLGFVRGGAEEVAWNKDMIKMNRTLTRSYHFFLLLATQQ